MGVIIAVLVLALVLAGLGFVVQALWWLAVIVFVFWLMGFAFRERESRWYRW